MRRPRRRRTVTIKPSLVGAPSSGMFDHQQTNGGRMLAGPELVNRSEPIPGTDLRVTLSTRWDDHAPIYVVGVISANGGPSRTTEHRDLSRARRAANRLYQRLTKEN